MFLPHLRDWAYDGAVDFLVDDVKYLYGPERYEFRVRLLRVLLVSQPVRCFNCDGTAADYIPHHDGSDACGGCSNTGLQLRTSTPPAERWRGHEASLTLKSHEAGSLFASMGLRRKVRWDRVTRCRAHAQRRSTYRLAGRRHREDDALQFITLSTDWRFTPVGDEAEVELRRRIEEGVDGAKEVMTDFLLEHDPDAAIVLDARQEGACATASARSSRT